MDFYEFLKRDAEYALRSKNKNLVYEAYGAAKAAYRLGAISFIQFFELNDLLVRNGINNPAAGLE